MSSIFITGCTGSCHFDNFQCSQWWKFHQNEDIAVSVIPCSLWGISRKLDQQCGSLLFTLNICQPVNELLNKGSYQWLGTPLRSCDVTVIMVVRETNVPRRSHTDDGLVHRTRLNPILLYYVPQLAASFAVSDEGMLTQLIVSLVFLF